MTTRRELLLEEERLLMTEEQSLLSRERTILSFMQTGLAFAGIGLVILNVLGQVIAQMVGFAFIFVGAVEVIESLRRLQHYRLEMINLKTRKRKLERFLGLNH